MNKPMQGEPWEWTGADDADEQTRTLRDYVGMVLQSWKLVVFIVLLAGSAGFYVALTTEPVYQTNALIHVEEESGSSLTEALDPISAIYGGQSAGMTEIEILRSRSVIQSVAKDLKLDILAEPHHFGALGATVARRSEGDAIARPPLGDLTGYLRSSLLWLGAGSWLPDLASYAWGGERIVVSRLHVPRALRGEVLVLVAEGNGRYHLKNLEGTLLLNGQVDESIRAVAASGARIGIYVAQLRARTGTEFLLTKLPMQEAVRRLQEDLLVAEKGTDTGILELTLAGQSSQAVQDRLNAIADSYLAQNVARQSAEARKTLAFVKTQLPQLRENVDLADAALRDYQAENGTVDLSLEAEALLEKLTAVQTRISHLNLQRTEMLRLYTEDHPVVESFESKRVRLEQQTAEIEEQLKKMPDIQSDYLKLARNVNVANRLYILLMNKAQQLDVVQAGVTGYVRIIDRAFAPLLPSGPNRTRILLVAVVLGFMLAMGLLLLRQALARTLETPDAIERKLGIPVYATIPHSKTQAEIYRSKRGKDARPTEPEVLARIASNDIAVESLRSLRTSLQFALIENQNNVVTITGPTPGLGKTFVALNLAYLLGDIDKRVLLIDADMRRGHVHKNLRVKRSPGLSEVIAGRCRIGQAIHPVDRDKVYFMSTGTIPPNPSELLLHDGFKRLIESVSKEFDLVLIDTPPMLNVTDGSIIGRLSGTNFLVVRSGASNLHEVELSMKRMQQNDIKLSGVIFNGLKANATKYGYGKYGYYAYQYKSSKAEA